MKKIFFYMLIALVTFSACTDAANQTTKASDSGGTQAKSITNDVDTNYRPRKKPMDSETAYDRLKKLSKAKLYDTVFTEFAVEDLKEIFCRADSGTITSAKFFLALYDTLIPASLHSSALVHIKVPQVILQITKQEKVFNSETLAPNYYYYSGSKICPPPLGGCRIQ